MIADTQLVIRGFVVEVFVKIKFLQRVRSFLLLQVKLILRIVLLGTFLQRRIRFQLLLDSRLQLQRRHLKQLHELNLLR